MLTANRTPSGMSINSDRSGSGASRNGRSALRKAGLLAIAASSSSELAVGAGWSGECRTEQHRRDQLRVTAGVIRGLHCSSNAALMVRSPSSRCSETERPAIRHPGKDRIRGRRWLERTTSHHIAGTIPRCVRSPDGWTSEASQPQGRPLTRTQCHPEILCKSKGPEMLTKMA